MDEREQLIVMCNIGKTFDVYPGLDLKLSVKTQQNYSMEEAICSPGECGFRVTVGPPASFTCVHEFNSDGEEKTLHSETYDWLDETNTNGTSTYCNIYLYTCILSFCGFNYVTNTFTWKETSNNWA